MRRRARQAIEEAPAAPETELEFARSLLADRDPAQVVAALLAASRSELVREPFHIETPAPRPAPRTTRRGESRRTDTGYARFRIHWGFRSGANPRRLLAAICRRGDARSHRIGAIDIGADSATFAVANAAAAAFELRARRRDARDVDQHIERVAPKTTRYRAG